MVTLKSSSLIEVIVSMLLLSIVSTITILIYLNISRSAYSRAMYLYQNEINMIWKTIGEAENSDELEEAVNTIQVTGTFQLKSTIDTYGDKEDLFQVKLTLSDTTQRIELNEKRLYYLAE